MGRFELFLTEVSERACGRPLPPGRWVPVFVPEGDNEQELFLDTIGYFSNAGYRFLDARQRSYDKAIAEFPLPWPRASGRWPRLSEFLTPTSETRLVILGGSDTDTTFWRNLCDEGVFCPGASFPYSAYVVVPDSATVVALIRFSHWRHYRKDYFAETLRYGSEDLGLVGGSS